MSAVAYNLKKLLKFDKKLVKSMVQTANFILCQLKHQNQDANHPITASLLYELSMDPYKK